MTDIQIAEDLVDMGVPKEDIVLGLLAILLASIYAIWCSVRYEPVKVSDNFVKCLIFQGNVI